MTHEMRRLTALQEYVAQHIDELVAASGDSQSFTRELTALRGYWAQGGPPEAMLNETAFTFQRYPAVWGILRTVELVAFDDEGITPMAAGAPQQSAPSPLQVPVTRRERMRSTSAAATPGVPAMNNDLSETTSDKLALWDHKLATAREVVAGCLAVAIVLVTLLTALVAVFAVLLVGDRTAWSAAKDVLVVLAGLVGVVLGYYFGRVPGEMRASKAEAEAKASASELNTTVAEVSTILDDGTLAGGARGELDGGVTLSPDQLARLRAVLGARRR